MLLTDLSYVCSEVQLQFPLPTLQNTYFNAKLSMSPQNMTISTPGIFPDDWCKFVHETSGIWLATITKAVHYLILMTAIAMLLFLPTYACLSVIIPFTMHEIAPYCVVFPVINILFLFCGGRGSPSTPQPRNPSPLSTPLDAFGVSLSTPPQSLSAVDAMPLSIVILSTNKFLKL